MGVLTIFNLLPYLLTSLFFIGLLIMIISQHDFFSVIRPTLKRLPTHIQRQLTTIADSQLKKNPLLSEDQDRISKEMAIAGLRFRNKPLTMRHFIVASFVFAIGFSVFAFILTTKQVDEISYYNFPAVIVAAFIGFILPRWGLLILSLRSKFKYQEEAPPSFYKITSSLRANPNFERAVIMAIPNLPKYTRKLCELALKNYYSRKFSTFPQMIHWISCEVAHPGWKEFAHLALTETTTGIQDIIPRMTILTTRAEELLGVQKDERKSIKFQTGLVIFPFVLLGYQLYRLTIKNPEEGIYLFTTPIGKLLISGIPVTFLAVSMILTWLYYRV